jgi:NitT/TauT family transport system permease protein
MAGFLKRQGLFFLAVVLLLIVWEILIHAFKIPSYLLPAPSDIAREILEYKTPWMYHAGFTLAIILLGFVSGLVVGVGMAVAITWSDRISAVVYPFLVIAQIVPKIALAPLLLIWLGYGLWPKVLVAFLVAFFPLVVDTAAGLQSTDPEIVDFARALKMSKWAVLRKVRFPAALPFIFGGMKVAITLAVIGAIVAEFVGSDMGLGYILIISGTYADTAKTFTAILIISFIGIVLYFMIERIEQAALPWYTIPRKKAEPSDVTAGREAGGRK